MKEVIIYTDGACLGNPGPGGYGAVLIYGDKRKELSGGYLNTTNNRMELRAVIYSLEALKFPCEVKLYSDSKYVTDAINKKWVYKWQKNNWMRAKNSQALNADLWARLMPLLEKHRVELIWVKGHADVTENERCDELAGLAAKNPTEADVR